MFNIYHLKYASKGETVTWVSLQGQHDWFFPSPKCYFDKITDCVINETSYWQLFYDPWFSEKDTVHVVCGKNRSLPFSGLSDLC